MSQSPSLSIFFGRAAAGVPDAFVQWQPDRAGTYRPSETKHQQGGLQSPTASACDWASQSCRAALLTRWPPP